MSNYQILKLLKVLSFIGVGLLVLIGLLGSFRLIKTDYISLLTIIITAFVVSPIYYKKIKGLN